MTDVYVTDPLVPIELVLPGGSRFTIYQPGWQQASDGAAAFLGAGGQVYAFDSLHELRRYVRSPATHDLSASPFVAGIRDWSVQDYSDRLCTYDLDEAPEAQDNRLAEHEQLALGSSLALLLDLLDFTGVEDPHADALRGDDDIDRLSQGYTIDSLFGGTKRRQHVAELVSSSWRPCVGAVTEHVTTPDVPDSPGGTAPAATEAPSESPSDTIPPAATEAPSELPIEDAAAVPNDTGLPASGQANPRESDPAGATDDSEGDVPLEDVVPALTMWFAFSDAGVYTIRTIEVTFGHPTYLGRYTSEGQLHLIGTAEPEHLPALVRARKVSPLPSVDLAAAAAEPDVTFTPSDDNIFDLVEIGAAIGPDMGVEDADQLVSAWTELVRLADWAGWSDVTALLGLTAPVGRFVTSCAIDLAQDRTHARTALGTAEVDDARQGWAKAVETIFGYVTVLDPANP